MKVNDIITEDLKTRISSFFKNIKQPNITFSVAVDRAMKDEAIRELAKGYIKIWQGTYYNLQNAYGNSLTDQIVQDEFNSLIATRMKARSTPTINKLAQEIVDLKDNLGTNVALQMMTKLVALSLVNRVKPPETRGDDVSKLQIPWGEPLNTELQPSRDVLVPIKWVNASEGGVFIKYNGDWYYNPRPRGNSVLVGEDQMIASIVSNSVNELANEIAKLERKDSTAKVMSVDLDTQRLSMVHPQMQKQWIDTMKQKMQPRV